MDTIRIMIVEDEALLAADLSDSLTEMGYAVTYVSSGEAALDSFENFNPALVIMDIHLKGALDGIQTAERLMDKRPLAIIFLTAFADEELIRRAKVAEPFGYLVKPVTIQMLHTNIEMALYKFRMEQERNRLLAELQQAQNEIETLQRFLPICAGCKKIRNDEGYWKEVEEYILDNLDVSISHGLCPDCIRARYPEIADTILKKKSS
jgi:DNA-binding response OmpR family regulator